MDGVETPMLTVEQVVYQDARRQLLPQAQQPRELMADVGKTLQALPAIPRALMVVAVQNMVTVARRPISKLLGLIKQTAVDVVTVAVRDAKVDVPLVVEEPQPIPSPLLPKQSLSWASPRPLAKLLGEQSQPTEHVALPMATLFVVIGLKDHAALHMDSVVKQQLTAATDVKADLALVLPSCLPLAHPLLQPILTPVL